MVIHRNYGLFISLALHLVIFMIPVSMIVSRHFKEIELFVIDERPVQQMKQVKEKIVKLKPKEIPKKSIPNEIIKEVQTEPVITESEIKEAPARTSIEPMVVSNNINGVPLSPMSAQLTPPLTSESVQTAHAYTTSKAASTKSLFNSELGSESGPKFSHREMPVYPMIARRLGKEGTVLLRLTIDEKGNLLNIEVVEKAGYGFTEAAIEAVKKSTFLPAIVDGKPVMSKALLRIKFSLLRD